MFTHSRLMINNPLYARLVLLAALLILVPSASALAQSVGSSRNLPSGGGTRIIKGRVYLPSGRPVESRLRVRLESPNTTTQSAVTDSDGAFVFNGVEAGDYQLTVEGGKQFEDVIEHTSVYRETRSDVMLTIQLKYKPESNPALAGIPKEAVDLYTKGSDEAKKGESKKAVEHLSGAVALYPNFAAALNELGIQYLRLNQPDKAAEVLQKAIKLTPTDYSPRLSLGIALLNKKNFAEAETALREALKLNENLPTAHMYLGIALLTLSRDEKTKQYDMAKYEEAQKELETATASNRPEVAMAHKYLGGIYMGNRDYKRAADELETYLKLTPKAPDAEKLKTTITELRNKK